MLFFFNDTATTEIYTLSLHDALPICHQGAADDSRGRGHSFVERGAAADPGSVFLRAAGPLFYGRAFSGARAGKNRSEEHTSELQSQSNLVCRLLLEKKKKNIVYNQVH